MCFERFDLALLHLLAWEGLARAFTVQSVTCVDWFVFQDGQCVGRIRESGEMYETDRVQFIPYSGAADHENNNPNSESG